MGWRTSPPAVQIKDVEDVIKRIKKLGLVDFIRTKETIDKPAMLKNPEKAKSVQGVSITQNEEFFVKPAELKVEVTGRKWKIESKKRRVRKRTSSNTVTPTRTSGFYFDKEQYLADSAILPGTMKKPNQTPKPEENKPLFYANQQIFGCSKALDPKRCGRPY